MSRKIGAVGEELAARFFSERGCRIVDRNFSFKTGEIDLIVQDGDTLVFVEVKARASSAYGLAQEFVGFAKRLRIIKTAMIYLQRSRWSGPVRFDVLAIQDGKIEHIPEAFDAGYIS